MPASRSSPRPLGTGRDFAGEVGFVARALAFGHAQIDGHLLPAGHAHGHAGAQSPRRASRVSRPSGVEHGGRLGRARAAARRSRVACGPRVMLHRPRRAEEKAAAARPRATRRWPPRRPPPRASGNARPARPRGFFPRFPPPLPTRRARTPPASTPARASARRAEALGGQPRHARQQAAAGLQGERFPFVGRVVAVAVRRAWRWPAARISRGTNFGQRTSCQRQKWMAVVQVCFSMSVLPSTCLTTTRPPALPRAGVHRRAALRRSCRWPSATPQPRPGGLVHRPPPRAGRAARRGRRRGWPWPACAASPRTRRPPAAVPPRARARRFPPRRRPHAPCRGSWRAPGKWRRCRKAVSYGRRKRLPDGRDAGFRTGSVGRDECKLKYPLSWREAQQVTLSPSSRATPPSSRIGTGMAGVYPARHSRSPRSAPEACPAGQPWRVFHRGLRLLMTNV